MNSAIPLARTVVGIPLAASAFATGFALQMGAHALQPVTHPEWDLSDAFADMDEDSASILR